MTRKPLKMHVVVRVTEGESVRTWSFPTEGEAVRFVDSREGCPCGGWSKLEGGGIFKAGTKHRWVIVPLEITLVFNRGGAA